RAARIDAAGIELGGRCDGTNAVLVAVGHLPRHGRADHNGEDLGGQAPVDDDGDRCGFCRSGAGQRGQGAEGSDRDDPSPAGWDHVTGRAMQVGHACNVGRSAISLAGSKVIKARIYRRALGLRTQPILSAALKTFFDLNSTAMRRAISWNNCAASLSGSATVMGTPSSPPSRSSGTNGSLPRRGTPNWWASSCPPPLPKIS